jgi:hypothetical protein
LSYIQYQHPVNVVSSITNTADCFFLVTVFDMDLREMLSIVHVY